MLTDQKPLPSGFGLETTAEEVLAGRDLRRKVAIVTDQAAAEALWTLSEKLISVSAGASA
jgi:hypothetical protein